MTISVIRNENSPIFIGFPLVVDATENMALGSAVTTVSATDADGDGVRFSITGDSVAQEFFYINPVTGVITLKKLLTTDTRSQYTVRNP